MHPQPSTKLSAMVTICLGFAAIVLPYFVGTMAVMLLAVVVLASGILALLQTSSLRNSGVPVSVFGPWVQIVAGFVLLIWPELALWLVAVVLGGSLILNGITGLLALNASPVVNQPPMKKVEMWLNIGIGAVLILMGAAGSAVLLGAILGIALIARGLQQWRLVNFGR